MRAHLNREAKTAMTDLLEKRSSIIHLMRALYNDPHMFRVDIGRKVFQKEWLFVGMNSEIPKRAITSRRNWAKHPVFSGA